VLLIRIMAGKGGRDWGMGHGKCVIVGVVILFVRPNKWRKPKRTLLFARIPKKGGGGS
jgi:hypothetical protein